MLFFIFYLTSGIVIWYCVIKMFGFYSIEKTSPFRELLLSIKWTFTAAEKEKILYLKKCMPDYEELKCKSISYYLYGKTHKWNALEVHEKNLYAQCARDVLEEDKQEFLIDFVFFIFLWPLILIYIITRLLLKLLKKIQ